MDQDLVATNILHFRFKVSIVHQSTSDHAMVYTLVNRNQKIPRTHVTKKKFDLEKAIMAVTANAFGLVDDCTHTLTLTHKFESYNTQRSRMYKYVHDVINTSTTYINNYVHDVYKYLYHSRL